MRAAAPYVPRALLHHLNHEPERRVRAIDGTCVFVDVSGFTKLSERLARRGGREGAEQLADAIGSCFENLLGVAYEKGGGLLKFGGDALLLLFDGEAHCERACASAVAMGERLRELGPIETGAAPVTLRMSVGVHSAEYLLFAVGSSHRELLISGAAASEVVRMEKEAGTGEIVVSAATADALPQRCLGAARGSGRLLRSPPVVIRTFEAPLPETIDATKAPEALSTELRAHVLAGPQPPEHRIVTVAFLRFEGTDGLVAERGAEGAADVLHELVTLVQEAADAEQVCFLGSDIDANGGKLILTAGAPRALGDEDERMLLALRRIAEAGPALPLRIGVTHGPLFAGDIGPRYRRTYTVMGDVVNLAARLMAKAPPGEIYSTPEVIERSSTAFQTTALEPFAVKGKALPVQAVAVGNVVHSRDATQRGPVPVRFPLVGRERELDQITRALDDAQRGRGRLIELVSEPGMGRSRLMEEVRDRAEGVRVLHATCEPYTMTTPYATWRELLRQLIGVAWDEADDVVLARLRETLERGDPSLLPWLSLLADAFDVEAPAGKAVEQLSPEFRAARLREVVLRFIRHELPAWALIEVADAHLMDTASAELVEALARELPLLPWVMVVSRRDLKGGFTATPGEHVLHLELEPLGPAESLALAEAATEAAPLPPHIVKLAAERSGGSPQFLRDLLRAAAAGSSELPDSVESAALARLDRLPPPDRALIRRASILGLSFHPRQLEDLLGDDIPAPDEGDVAAPRRLLQAGVGRLPALPPRGRARRRLRGAAVPRQARAARRGRRPARARPRRRRRRRRRPPRRPLPPRGRARQGVALLAPGRATARASGRRSPTPPTSTAARSKSAHHARRAARGARRGLGVARRRLPAHRRAGAQRSRAQRPPGAWSPATRCAPRTCCGCTRGSPSAPARSRARSAGAGARCARSTVSRTRRRSRAARTSSRRSRRCASARVGRREATRLAREAIAEAEAAGEELALGHACQILDWALIMSGRATEPEHSARALEIFRRHGAADRESAVLNNMGAFAYRAGRWDDAIALYRAQRRRERARRRRQLRRVHGLQRRRAAVRPGPARGRRAAAAARAPGLARDGRRARRRVRHRAARAAARARRARRRVGRAARGRARAVRGAARRDRRRAGQGPAGRGRAVRRPLGAGAHARARAARRAARRHAAGAAAAPRRRRRAGADGPARGRGGRDLRGARSGPRRGAAARDRARARRARSALRSQRGARLAAAPERARGFARAARHRAPAGPAADAAAQGGRVVRLSS